MTVFDHQGNELFFDQKPKKIISLLPCITETLYDLNLEESVVAITKNCNYPPHFKHLKQTLALDSEVIDTTLQNLDADIIFYEANQAQKLDFANSAAKLFCVDVKTVAQNSNFIQLLGTLLNRRTEANLLITKINLQLEQLKTFSKELSPIKTAYFTSYNPWMALGNTTFANDLLALIKLENIYDDFTNQTVINPKRIRHDGDPEILLFPSSPFCFEDKHAFEISEFTNRSSAIFVDGTSFTFFGSRFLKTIPYLQKLRKRINQGSSFLN